MKPILRITVCAILLSTVTVTSIYARDGKAENSKMFIRNIGQVTDQLMQSREDIDFKVKGGNGLNIFIGSGEIHYQWAKTEPATKSASLFTKEKEAETPSSPKEMYRMDVKLVGADPNAKVISEEQHVFFERYYLPSVKEAGSKAHAFGRITYKDVYPHIDWVFYFNSNGKLEHDFIVHPGGKVSDIKIRYTGATDLRLTIEGSLTATSPFGTVTESAPVTYQQADRKPVVSSFVLRDNTLSFLTASFSGILVIDPTLGWATYYGDNDYDEITGITTDTSDYIYTCGSTNSISNIATTGAYQSTFGGGSGGTGSDAIVMKFTKDGDCIWATYYGGTSIDLGKGITMDTSGNLYLAGRTQSTASIASTGSYQDTKAGNSNSYDAFVTKFDTSGQRIWSTYYGGTGIEGSQSIAIHADKFDNLYLTGNTQSANGIATTGAFQELRPGGHDAFLAKFDTDGNLDWGTYFGGSASDYGTAVTTDNAGDIYLAGYTGNASDISTPGTYQTVFGGGNDAFLAKFTPFGERLWATYYGGSDIDWAFAITADDSGNVYMGGTTLSTSSIATSNAYQAIYGGGSQDGFLAKFDSSGQIDWGTYYGGNGGNESISSLYYSTINNHLYLVGVTGSTDGIATPGAINGTLYGSNDAMIASFMTSGDINWGSYFGGNDGDGANGITGDDRGNIFLTGLSNSAIGMATANAYQTTFGGLADGIILNVKDCESPAISGGITGDDEVCSGIVTIYSVPSITGAESYNWNFPNGWSGSSDTNSIEITIGQDNGAIALSVSNYCSTSDTIVLDITVNPLPAPDMIRNANVLTTTQTFSTYQWNKNGSPISGAANPTYVVTENGNYSVTVTNPEGCEGTSDELLVDDIVGINDLLALKGIKIYPNPVSKYLYLDMPSNAFLQILDLNGRILKETSLESGRTKINLEKLSIGTYLLKVYDPSRMLLGTSKISKI